jgi:hypothetical protein
VHAQLLLAVCYMHGNHCWELHCSKQFIESVEKDVFILAYFIQRKYRTSFNSEILLFTKNVNHQQMHKEFFFICCNKLLHVSTLLGHLQGELSVVVTLRLHYTVERECAIDCVLRCFWRHVQAETTENSRLQKQRSTQSTAHPR